MLPFFTKQNLIQLQSEKKTNKCLIFLSGPSAMEVCDEVLLSRDVIAVNGSANYLVDKGIQPFIYLVTDGRFPVQRFDEFKRLSEGSRYTFINQEVFNHASGPLQEWLKEHCFILKELYKREKAGPFKKLKYSLYCWRHKSVVMDVPYSRKKRIKGFSKDITIGYCNCKTVAYAAMQLVYSLAYTEIVCAGLDLTQGGQRFYETPSVSKMPSELTKDTQKIIDVLRFMKENIDPPIYTLSRQTVIPYEVIPFIDQAKL